MCATRFDHRPILIRLNNEDTRAKGSKPFRFLASLLTNNCFSSFVSQVWNKDADYNSLSRSLPIKLITGIGMSLEIFLSANEIS